MYALRRLSCPSFFQPSTNRRMYRLLSKGLIGAPWGVPRPSSRLRVLRCLFQCSDTDEIPKPPWRERKVRYLARLPSASPDARLVSAADKLHNLRAIVADYRQIGEDLWTR